MLLWAAGLVLAAAILGPEPADSRRVARLHGDRAVTVTEAFPPLLLVRKGVLAVRRFQHGHGMPGALQQR